MGTCPPTALQRRDLVQELFDRCFEKELHDKKGSDPAAVKLGRDRAARDPGARVPRRLA